MKVPNKTSLGISMKIPDHSYFSALTLYRDPVACTSHLIYGKRTTKVLGGDAVEIKKNQLVRLNITCRV